MTEKSAENRPGKEVILGPFLQVYKFTSKIV